MVDVSSLVNLFNTDGRKIQTTSKRPLLLKQKFVFPFYWLYVMFRMNNLKKVPVRRRDGKSNMNEADGRRVAPPQTEIIIRDFLQLLEDGVSWKELGWPTWGCVDVSDNMRKYEIVGDTQKDGFNYWYFRVPKTDLIKEDVTLDEHGNYVQYDTYSIRCYPYIWDENLMGFISSYRKVPGAEKAVNLSIMRYFITGRLPLTLKKKVVDDGPDDSPMIPVKVVDYELGM